MRPAEEDRLVRAIVDEWVREGMMKMDDRHTLERRARVAVRAMDDHQKALNRG